MSDDTDIDTEIQAIEDGMADDFTAYEADPALKERYGALLEARDAGTTAPAKPDAATVRRGELETLMGDRHSPYWSGSKAERLQQEYRELLGDERPAGDQGEGRATTSEQAVALTDGDVSNAIENVAAMGVVGAAWSAELAKGGAKGALGTMEDARLAMLAGMGETAVDVQIAFEANLSADAQAAAYKEMANPYTPAQPDASPDYLARFRETPAGKILSAEWGGATARNLSRVLFRADRMGMDLEDADADQLDDMFQRLTTAERAAVLRQLAR